MWTLALDVYKSERLFWPPEYRENDRSSIERISGLNSKGENLH